MVGCVLYCIFFEPSNSLSIVWHFCTASLFVFGVRNLPLLTVIISVYGGLTFYVFSFFPLLANSTTMYVFMIILTFMGSLCLTWLIHPPEILLFKPVYFPRLFYCSLAQFILMVISFFNELTVEDPYTRKAIYIEGVTFIFL